MDVRKLKGIAVISISDGEKVGTIRDALFNIDERRIQGLTVNTGSFLSSSQNVIDMAFVQSIGSDAVMVGDRSAIGGERSETRYQAFMDTSTLTSLKVVTESGDFVGTVATARIDQQDGKLTDLEINTPGIAGTFKSNIVVPIERVISIGKDVVVVPGDVGNSDKADSTATAFNPFQPRQRDEGHESGTDT